MKNTVLLICAVLTVNTIAGVCPAWNETAVYNQGDDVCYNNQAYEVAPNVYNISGYDYRPDGPYAHFWQATDDCDCEEPQQKLWMPRSNDIYNTNTGGVCIGGVQTSPGVKFEVDGKSRFNDDIKIQDMDGKYAEIKSVGFRIEDPVNNASLHFNTLQNEIVVSSRGLSTLISPASVTTDNIHASSVFAEGMNINGELTAKQVTVTLDAFPDYVFSPSHKLKSLPEIEAYIREHGTLPGMPSESEVKAEGVDLGKLNVKLLEKIEEMTLHLINLEKKNKTLEKKVSILENRVENK